MTTNDDLPQAPGTFEPAGDMPSAPEPSGGFSPMPSEQSTAGQTGTTGSGQADWGYYPPPSENAGWVGSIGAGVIGWLVYGVGWIIAVFVTFFAAVSGVAESKRQDLLDAFESQDADQVEKAFEAIGSGPIASWGLSMLIATGILVLVAVALHKLFFRVFNSGHRVSFGGALVGGIGGWFAGIVGLFGDALLAGFTFGLVSLLCAGAASGAIMRAMAKRTDV